MLQQDKAMAHTANVTQNLCRDNLPQFWSKVMWPPCSPDLNLMDFSIKTILEAKACLNVYHMVKDLKDSLELTWQKIPYSQLRAAVEDVGRRLKSVVTSKAILSKLLELLSLFFMYL